MSQNRDGPIKAKVIQVIERGRHGPYAKAIPEEKIIPGSVTFALKEGVWHEPEWPEAGHFVMLDDLREKPAGWRAHNARFFRPADKPKTEQKE
jgi:hypothetical protein